MQEAAQQGNSEPDDDLGCRVARNLRLPQIGTMMRDLGCIANSTGKSASRAWGTPQVAGVLLLLVAAHLKLFLDGIIEHEEIIAKLWGAMLQDFRNWRIHAIPEPQIEI